MKKAFCEPKNVEFCPPIAIVSALAFGLEPDSKGAVTVSRTPENGGDVTFTTRSELEASFADEALHPGDLKTAATVLIVEALEKLAAGIKADGDATKASKTLKATLKKLAKKK
jgi:hypothetical protein